MRLSIDPVAAIVGMLPRNSVGVEIGVHLGDLSERLVKTLKPSHLTLVDPWHAFEQPEYQESWYSGARVTQEKMDARYEAVKIRMARFGSKVEIVRDFSVPAASRFQDGSLDWVYIDGDHTYDGCKADIAAYDPKVKVGGFLIGDDYVLGEWWGRGVVDAFNELIGQGRYVIALKVGTQVLLRKLPPE